MFCFTFAVLPTAPSIILCLCYLVGAYKVTFSSYTFGISKNGTTFLGEWSFRSRKVLLWFSYSSSRDYSLVGVTLMGIIYWCFLMLSLRISVRSSYIYSLSSPMSYIFISFLDDRTLLSPSFYCLSIRIFPCLPCLDLFLPYSSYLSARKGSRNLN